MSFAPMKEELSRWEDRSQQSEDQEIQCLIFPGLSLAKDSRVLVRDTLRFNTPSEAPQPPRQLKVTGRDLGAGAGTGSEQQLLSPVQSNSLPFRGDQSNMSLDSSLTLLDDTVNSASGVWNRSSLLEALKQEKDNRPESYWRV